MNTATGSAPPSAGGRATSHGAATSKKSERLKTACGLLVGGLLVWYWNSGSSPDSKSPRPTEAACRADLKCWAEKGRPAAGAHCREPIEKLGRFQIRWTDGWLDGKFAQYRWSNQTAGIVEYRGDKAEAQNGFGAWQRIIYECHFNVASSGVSSVRAQPGRLPE